MTNAQVEVARVRLRRAIGCLLFSAVLPGSVQRYVGNRRVGVLAARVLAGLFVSLVVVGLSVLIAPGATVGFLLTPWVTVVCRVALWMLFIGWVALLVDSWRLSRPMELPQRARLAMTLTVVALAVVMGLVTNLIAGAFAAAGNVGSVLPGGGDTEKKAGRYNIMLLGVDASDERIGVRADSVNVASINAETGQTVIFGLPRNMQGVPFPKDSPMHAIYPDGFRCANNECMLNAIWTVAEEHADQFPEGLNVGLAATKAAVGETLGLDINYYALVDMHGFSSIIDAMGGINIDVMKRIPIGGGSSPVFGYIEPGKDVHLDGKHALWFARSRHGSSDYERMQRQKCVMSAMVAQLDPQVVATRFVELSEAGKDLLLTDVPRDQIVELAGLALEARNRQIASVNFMPPLIPDTAHPDFGLIRETVQSAIKASEQSDKAGKSATTAAPSPQLSAPPAHSINPAPQASASASATLESDDKAYTAGQTTGDLQSVCSVN
ncbi:LCP family protein [uncultured Tessaracoccus sp.]|uniref:LCP family protein n=1 Tax=uncultured Tessaracoccus sp. TaxID=905023 RepID=UPI002639CFD5|nr:LCP family protein [uncultured Tessaracoccus sp.]